MNRTPRQRFLDYVRRVPGARPVVSPFGPDPEVVKATLHYMGLPADENVMGNEIRLANALDYEPMFMTDCMGLIFPWREDKSRSDEEWIVSTISTPKGEWTQRLSRRAQQWGNDEGFPVKAEKDHEMLVSVCAQIGTREAEIRQYYRQYRERVGEEGVIVIGHPQVHVLGMQISQRNMILHYVDYPETYRRSMDAVCEAARFVFEIAMAEGIDFMSDATFALEVISPAWFDMHVPYLRSLADCAHDHGGLFWFHNCGKTRELILSGRFNRFHADVIETIAPPPEGDNDLQESRRHLDASVCSKGNLSLRLLRNGSVEEVVYETKKIVRAVRGYAHIFSTADAVLSGTPPENLVAFVRTAREESQD